MRLIYSIVLLLFTCSAYGAPSNFVSSDNKVYGRFFHDSHTDEFTGFLCHTNGSSSVRLIARKQVFDGWREFEVGFQHLDNNSAPIHYKRLRQFCGTSRPNLKFFSIQLESGEDFRIQEKHVFSGTTVTTTIPTSVYNTYSSQNGKRYGILYHTWHCPVSGNAGDAGVKNNTAIINQGQNNWAPVGWPSWINQPLDGYYCLTNNEALIRKHAVLLKGAGIDYIYIDITNWPQAYTTSSSTIKTAEFKEKIHDPVMKLFEVYEDMHLEGQAVPKIVAWAGVSNTYKTNTQNDVTLSYGQTLAKWLNTEFWSELNSRPYLKFFTESSKPLLMVKVAKGKYKWGDNVRPLTNDTSNTNSLHNKYKVQKTWGHVNHTRDSDPANNPFEPMTDAAVNQHVWSFLEKCEVNGSGIPVSTCNQRVATGNSGADDQVSVAAAYQWDYMQGPQSQAKNNGKTLYKQFQRVFSSNNIKYINLTGWNEWLAKRHCFGDKTWSNASFLPAYDNYNYFDGLRDCDDDELDNPDGDPPTYTWKYDSNGNPKFVDGFNGNWSKGMEPNRDSSDCYYQLMKSLIMSERLGDNGLNSTQRSRFNNSSHCNFNI